MGLRARILAATSETGPLPKNVLHGLARTEKQREQFDAIFQSMIDNRELVMRSDKRHAKYGPPRARGFAVVEMVVIAIILGIVAAAFTTTYQIGKGAGAAEVQAAWDKKKLEEARFTRERDAERDKRILEVQQQRAAAQKLAEQYATEREEAKREARRSGTQLVACRAQPRPNQGAVATGGQGAGGDATPGAGAPGLAGDRVDLPDSPVFTWEFVRQFDGGWTGLDGKPVSHLAPGREGAQRSGPTEFTAQDIADVGGVNGERCSEDRREFAALIAKISAAADNYDKVRR